MAKAVAGDHQAHPAMGGQDLGVRRVHAVRGRLGAIVVR